MAALVQFKQGFKDGIPIGLGYLSVSFTFGMMAIRMGLDMTSAVLISLTNLTSAGQFAGLTIIANAGSLMELALSQVLINLRYLLMSLSLSQKIERKMTLVQRAIVSFAVTDEIFAMASAKKGRVVFSYFLGLMCLPILCWVMGTAFGALSASWMPVDIQQAFGIAIYGMFLAIIIPPMKEDRAIMQVVLLAAFISCILSFSFIGAGFSIILCAVLSAGILAYLHPIEEEME
ncbi:MAG: AzlC family ABC transporter permease [Erysipelotrichaceae bacterium]|nr:AzlC family ABC transporter permease [Erysipelotrichaceae bacterium]MCI9524914.1 AzlC family ABC transporter permease [Erysipelotrichaceae bacterium]